MHASGFESLLAQFCELAGARLPRLSAQAQDGSLNYWLSCRSVPMLLRHEPQRHPGHLLLRAVFGEAQRSREAEVLRDLLHAQWLMHEPGAPSFARDPASGEIVLQYVLDLETTTPQALLRGVQALSESALRWRKDQIAHDRFGAAALGPAAGRVFA